MFDPDSPFRRWSFLVLASLLLLPAFVRVRISSRPAEAADPPAVRTVRAMESGPPPIGWTTPGTVVSVYDGDTLTVRVTREFRVRMLGLWSPEVRTRDAAEKQRGIAARDHLRGLLPEGSPVVLSVPTQGADVAEAWSMGRILGHVWRPGDRQTLSRQMIDAGHGTAVKQD